MMLELKMAKSLDVGSVKMRENYNGDKTTEIMKERERYANDVNFKLAKNLRTILRKALLTQVTYRNDTTEALLGNSESKKYIGFLMGEGMNWNNVDLIMFAHYHRFI